MPAFRTKMPGLALPTHRILWLLEGGIALILSAYLTYQCYQPLARELSRSLDIQAGSILPILILAAIVFPLSLALMTLLVLFAAGLLSPAMRISFDMLVLTIAITALIVPTLQNILNTPRSPPLQSRFTLPSAPVQTGPLNVAPAPLKSIPLGAEVLNAGTQTLEVGVLFVRVTDNGRSYCAGKPLSSGNKDRHRLAAGASMVFMSGNCQHGHVALTVWDAAGQRIYQTSATLPPASKD